MGLARTTRATMVAIALAAMAFGVAMLAHSAEQFDTDIVQVPLDESDPERSRVGDLVYMGGIDIPPMGQNIGGLSGLRWDAESGRLLAITDDARWVWMTPTELNERLVGLGAIEAGPLLGMDGEPLTGKEDGDSESLTRHPKDGGWVVGFERNHRIWHYPKLSGLPTATDFDISEFGALEDNDGLETLASSELLQLVCVERPSEKTRPNCGWSYWGAGGFGPRLFGATPSDTIAKSGGVPTDADVLSGDTALILFRSWSRANGNGAAIVSYRPDGTRRELATFRPPLTVDNFEGLAIREEGERTFLYIVSDDNFSSNQRTLLMKFEVLPEG